MFNPVDSPVDRQAAIELLCRALKYRYEEGYAVALMLALPPALPANRVLDALCDNCDHVSAACPHYPCQQYCAIESLLSGKEK